MAVECVEVICSVRQSYQTRLPRGNSLALVFAADREQLLSSPLSEVDQRCTLRLAGVVFFLATLAVVRADVSANVQYFGERDATST